MLRCHSTAFLQVADGDETRLSYGQLASNGSNIKIVNNGHTVQVVRCSCAAAAACAGSHGSSSVVAQDAHGTHASVLAAGSKGGCLVSSSQQVCSAQLC